MDFYQNVKPHEDKLTKLLAEEKMVHTLKTQQYPILLTISQDASPDAQMELFSTRGDGLSSRDALLQFIFKLEGLEIRTDNRLIISDDLMNKIKGYAKKIYHAYLEGFFVTTIMNQAKQNAPCNTESTTEEPAPDTDESAAVEPDEFADFFDNEELPTDK